MRAGVVVLRARFRFAAPDQRLDQLLFLSPATGILLVTESIDADVFERIGQRADETLALGHREIRVADVVGLVKQQPEAQYRRFGIVDRQRRQPDGVAIGARLCRRRCERPRLAFCRAPAPGYGASAQWKLAS